jgi:hypothetical protein
MYVCVYVCVCVCVTKMIHLQSVINRQGDTDDDIDDNGG